MDLDGEWAVCERGGRSAAPAAVESLFTVANGYLGWRGTPDEGEPAAHRGAYLNGMLESWPLVHAEQAHGLTSEGQMMVPVTEGQLVALTVDGEPVRVDRPGLEHVERRLDLRAGRLERELVYRTRTGRRVRITSVRMVSLVRRHIGLVSYQIVPLDEPVVLELSARLCAPDRAHELGVVARDEVTSLPAPGILRPLHHAAAGTRLTLAHRANHSRLPVVCVADHVVEHQPPASVRAVAAPDHAALIVTTRGQPGRPLRLTKVVAYRGGVGETPLEELQARAELDLDAALQAGEEGLLVEQRQRLDAFWSAADIRLAPASSSDEPVAELQGALRFNLFHVLQAAACLNGAAMPAMGLTSNAYQGHTMWDLDAYVMPFLCATCPELARPLVGFRHGTLDAARRRAREMGLRSGASYPWRTINGEEASAFFPAAAAQVHVNGSVARAADRYAHAAGDRTVLHGPVAEILVETARLWTHLLGSERSDGQFSSHTVTGPDEFTAMTDDDLYTNLCARENLRMAAEVVGEMVREDPVAFAHLGAAAGVSEAEVERWRQISERVLVPFDEQRGLHAQDASFLAKPPWDFEGTHQDDFPLYSHFHPLILYRHQVLKQPSVVHAMMEHLDDFTSEELRTAFDHYDPLTAGESTLSLPVQAMSAYAAGRHKLAMHYTRLALLVDLADVHGSTGRGLHIGAMAGSWQAIARGLAGLSDQRGEVVLRPVWIQELAGLSLRLHIEGARVHVNMGAATTTYTLESGRRAKLRHHQHIIDLTTEHHTVTVATAALAASNP